LQALKEFTARSTSMNVEVHRVRTEERALMVLTDLNVTAPMVGDVTVFIHFYITSRVLVLTSVHRTLAKGRIAVLSPLAAANAFVRRVR